MPPTSHHKRGWGIKIEYKLVIKCIMIEINQISLRNHSLPRHTRNLKRIQTQFLDQICLRVVIDCQYDIQIKYRIIQLLPRELSITTFSRRCWMRRRSILGIIVSATINRSAGGALGILAWLGPWRGQNLKIKDEIGFLNTNLFKDKWLGYTTNLNPHLLTHSHS